MLNAAKCGATGRQRRRHCCEGGHPGPRPGSARCPTRRDHIPPMTTLVAIAEPVASGAASRGRARCCCRRCAHARVAAAGGDGAWCRRQSRCRRRSACQVVMVPPPQPPRRRRCRSRADPAQRMNLRRCGGPQGRAPRGTAGPEPDHRRAPPQHHARPGPADRDRGGAPPGGAPTPQPTRAQAQPGRSRRSRPQPVRARAPARPEIARTSAGLTAARHASRVASVPRPERAAAQPQRRVRRPRSQLPQRPQATQVRGEHAGRSVRQRAVAAARRRAAARRATHARAQRRRGVHPAAGLRVWTVDYTRAIATQLSLRMPLQADGARLSGAATTRGCRT
jgi:hypothetical protein